MIYCITVPAGAASGSLFATPTPTQSWHLGYIPIVTETSVNERGVLVTPETGALSIDSDPSGASVSLDGTVVGTTPYSADDVAFGTHTVLLTLAGYHDYDDTITITADQELDQSYDLVPVANENKKTSLKTAHKPRVHNTLTAEETTVPEMTLKVPSGSHHPENEETLANLPPTTTKPELASRLNGNLQEQENFCHLDATGKCTGICPETGQNCEATKNPACEGTKMSQLTQCGCVDPSSRLSLLVSGLATVKTANGNIVRGAAEAKAKPGIVESLISSVVLFFHKTVLGRPDISSSEIQNYRQADAVLATNVLCAEFYSPTLLTYAGDTTGGIDPTSGDSMVGHFAWDSADPGIRSVVWQLSVLPFPSDQGNVSDWSDIPGLLAHGNLNADKRTFSIDFSQSVPTGTNIVNAWSDKRPLMTLQKGALVTLKNGISAGRAGAAAQAETARIDTTIATINTKLARPAAAFTLRPVTQTAVMQRLSTAASSTAAHQTAKYEISPGVLAPSLGTPLVTKEGIANTLPQSQRVYYVRVLPFDWQGNYTGNPSNTKIIAIGEPLYNITGPGVLQQDPAEPLLLESDHLDERGHSIGELDREYVTYKLTKNYPITSGYVTENVTWDRTTPVGFAWNTSRPDLVSAVWQVSDKPFDQINPVFNDPGIVAQGIVNVSTTDPDYLVSTTDQCDYHGQIEPGDAAAKKANHNTLCTALPPSIDKAHMFGISFSAFATKPDNNSPGLTRYYVRVITSEQTGIPLQYVTHVSAQTEVDWVPSVSFQYEGCTLPTYIPYTYEVPYMQIINYTPIHPRDPDYNCWGIVTTGDEYWENWYATNFPSMPHGDKDKVGTVEWYANSESDGHHDDEIINLCNPPQEDSHWYDAIVDFFDGLVNFFEQILDMVSDAYNTIKMAIITEACLGSSDSTCQTIASTGLDIALAAEGIPPTVPSFGELMNEGAGYLSATMADEMGVPVEAVAPVVDSTVTALEHVPNPNDNLGIQPYPPKQYQPAKITIQLTNLDPVNTTPPGQFSITDDGDSSYWDPFMNTEDITPAWYPLYRTEEPVIPFPSLQPGQTITFPVVLRENQYVGDSCSVCWGSSGYCQQSSCNDLNGYGFTSAEWGDYYLHFVNGNMPDRFHVYYDGMGQDLIDNITGQVEAKNNGVQLTNTSWYIYGLTNPDCHKQTYRLELIGVNTNMQMGSTPSYSTNWEGWDPSSWIDVTNVGSAQGAIPGHPVVIAIGGH
jgi:hypothetical protein